MAYYSILELCILLSCCKTYAFAAAQVLGQTTFAGSTPSTPCSRRQNFFALFFCFLASQPQVLLIFFNFPFGFIFVFLRNFALGSSTLASSAEGTAAVGGETGAVTGAGIGAANGAGTGAVTGADTGAGTGA